MDGGLGILQPHWVLSMLRGDAEGHGDGQSHGDDVSISSTLTMFYHSKRALQNERFVTETYL